MAIQIDIDRVINWGEFIDIVGLMYVPGVLNPPFPANFPTGWKPVKYIIADAAFGPIQTSEFMGLVAQSEDNSNHYAIVLHGSKGLVDFLDDFEFQLEDFTLVPSGGKTEFGFTRFFESFSFVDVLTNQTETLGQYLTSLQSLPAVPSFTVSGHSLGGALASLQALVLASHNIPVEAYIFASPMVGDSTFVNTYNNLVGQSLRIVNKPDIVPQLPGSLLGYEHAGTLFEINSLDVPEIKRCVSCYHPITTYLYTLGATTVDLKSCRANGSP